MGSSFSFSQGVETRPSPIIRVGCGILAVLGVGQPGEGLEGGSADSENKTWITLIWVGVLLSPFAVILAVQAYKRGYNLGVWFVAGLVSSNPLFPLVLLGIMPHRTRQAQRRLERERLEGALAETTILPEGPDQVALGSTPSEPTAQASPDRKDRSLGDQETQL
jgi:hypothetical protein